MCNAWRLQKAHTGKEVEQVTDDDVQTAIMAETAVTMDDPDATVQKGDTADIAYVGKVDGKEFDGGSSDSYNLVIGSGTFIDGFEDGVIGMKTGETKDLNLKFPDSYQSTDLAGKDVVFTVTVNAFTRPAENIDGWELDECMGSKKYRLQYCGGIPCRKTRRAGGCK